jgi:pilus assembly protein CpaB
MNPRQRRAILLLALSALGLLGVFVLVAGYVADVRGEVDPKVEVLALSKPVHAREIVTDDMVKEIEVPKRWAPRNALDSAGQLVGLVAGTDLQPDTVLQRGMLVAPPELAPGQREVAILVDAETGVAGKIGPDSIVDIIATYARNDRQPDESEVVVAGARIIDVGQPALQGGRGVQEANADPKQVVPVTFALTPKQDLAVTHAETFAQEVRLALLRPGDESALKPDERVFRRAP